MRLCLIASLIWPSLANAAKSNDELDLLMKKSEPQVAAQIELRKVKLSQLQAEVDDLRLQIEQVKQKISVTRYIQNGTVVVSLVLGVVLGKLLKRDVLAKIRTNPYGIRIVGSAIASVGLVTTGGTAYGHYLVKVKVNDLSALEEKLDSIERAIEEQNASLNPSRRQP